MTLNEIVTVSIDEKSDSSMTVDMFTETELIVKENGIVENVELNGLSVMNGDKEHTNDYLLLGWDLDLTGRRLIDEMFHVAACAVDKDIKFTQYIMPSINLSPAACSRHFVTIVNASRYRMLKDLRSRKTLRSRSEYSGLILFMEWLENLLKDNSYKKIVLMWHDSQKIAPLILLKSLQRYNMLERFSDCVAGFLDTRELIKTECSHLKAFSQRSLMKSCLKYAKKQNESLRNALYRAQLTASLIEKLFNNNVSILLKYLYTVDDKVKELNEMRQLLDLQKSLKPIFLPFLQYNWTKLEANRLRKLLAVNNFDFTTLQMKWQQNGIDGLKEMLATQLNSKDLNVLIGILDSYFDPNKKSYICQEWFNDLGEYKKAVKGTVNMIVDKIDYLFLNNDKTSVKEKQVALHDVKMSIKRIGMCLEKVSSLFIS